MSIDSKGRWVLDDNSAAFCVHCSKPHEKEDLNNGICDTCADEMMDEYEASQQRENLL